MQMVLANGTDQAAAASQFEQETRIQVAQRSNQSINGLPATTIIGDITQQSQDGQQTQKIRVIASFISHGGNVYMLAGMSLPNDFNAYQRNFEYTIGSFAQLTDQSKLNRQPERIRIVTNSRSQTLQQALQGAGIPQDRLLEFSVLNGMELNETLPAGMLFKAKSGGSK